MTHRTYALTSLLSVCLCAAVLAAGCGKTVTNNPPKDAGHADGGGGGDAGGGDGGGGDAGKPDGGGGDAGQPDAGGPDAGGPDAGGPDGGRPSDGGVCASPSCITALGCLADGACGAVAGTYCHTGTIGLSCGNGTCDCGEVAGGCVQDCGCVAGTCRSGNICVVSGQCDPVNPAQRCDGATGSFAPSCGDGFCDCGETATSCSADCAGGGCTLTQCQTGTGCVNDGTCGTITGTICKSGVITNSCGNGTCDCGETTGTCPQDCGCGAGNCRDLQNNCYVPGQCIPGVSGIICGPNGTPGSSCGNGTCDCGETQASCGQDCGCLANTCQAGSICVNDGQCDPTRTGFVCQGSSSTFIASCGNGTCEQACGETCVSCPADCGGSCASCGNGTCEPGLGETCTTCPQDCVCYNCPAPAGTCNSPDVCCVSTTNGQGSCVPNAGACTGAKVTCDGPEDCKNAEVCCGKADFSGATASCLPSSSCVPATFGIAAELCHNAADCPSGKPTCQTCTYGQLSFQLCTSGKCP